MHGRFFAQRGLPPMRRRARRRTALTLIELVVVLLVLAVLASLLVPLLTGAASDARERATRESLRQLQDLIGNRYAVDMGGVLSDTLVPEILDGLPGPAPGPRAQHPQLHFLFVNPTTGGAASTFDPIVQLGWNGPYLMSGHGMYPGLTPATAAARGFDAAHGVAGQDHAVLDGWGNPIVILTTVDSVTVPDTSGATEWIVSAGPDGDLTSEGDNLWLPL